MTSVEEVAQWWGTSVSRMEPGVIELRGRPVQDLIGSTSLPSMIWLLLRGSLPAPGEAALLEAALVASVDHGPQAPSIAAARMAVTCGVGLNTAIATGAGMLGDSHGGAGEQAVELLGEIRDAERGGADLTAATARVLAAWRAQVAVHPRLRAPLPPARPAPRPAAVPGRRRGRDGVVDGDYLRAALAVEEALNKGRSRPVPMNIDGATAVIYAELGFAAAAGARAVRTEPVGRHPRPRVGGVPAGTAQQGPDARRRSCPHTSVSLVTSGTS